MGLYFESPILRHLLFVCIGPSLLILLLLWDKLSLHKSWLAMNKPIRSVTGSEEYNRNNRNNRDNEGTVHLSKASIDGLHFSLFIGNCQRYLCHLHYL